MLSGTLVNELGCAVEHPFEDATRSLILGVLQVFYV